jgi:hypothetical protein
VVDTARLSVCERVVRGNAAVLAAHWRRHLVADFAVDHVATGEDVGHVRAKELIETDLTFVANFDAGLEFASGQIVLPNEGENSRRGKLRTFGVRLLKRSRRSRM